MQSQEHMKIIEEINNLIGPVHEALERLAERTHALYLDSVQLESDARMEEKEKLVTELEREIATRETELAEAKLEEN